MLSALLPESVTDLATLRGNAQLNDWPTLLVADSDEEMTRALVCFFEKRGFHVAAGSCLADVRPFLHRRKNWTLIICDYHLPDGTGAELYEWVREQGCDAPVLLMSGSPHCATLCAGYDYLPKPFPIEKLEAYVRNVQHHV
jgi:DNA-binding response OmpR family regulator